MRCLTVAIMRRLNAKAIRANANRTIRPSAIDRLPKDKVFPVSNMYLHNDTDVRCTIVLDATGRTAELDITLDDFNRLPTVDMPMAESETDRR